MSINKKPGLFLVFAISAVFFLAAGYYFYCLNKAKNLNIILITVDALRPDHLGCYGYQRNTSPNIDLLAGEGFLFSQAIAQASWTVPSLSSLMTSKYPKGHQAEEWGAELGPAVIILPQVLNKYGYNTVGVVNICSLDKLSKSLFGRGFNLFKSNLGNSNALKMTKWVMNWLEGNSKRKFFLWIHYLDPHAPYNAPAEYKKIFLDDDIYRLSGKNIPFGNKSSSEYKGGWGSIPLDVQEGGIEDPNYYIAQYDSEIKFMDDQVGLLLAKMKQLNIYDKTIIIITADHGENLGEHNWYFKHSISLYDTLIKVPLIIRNPAIQLKKNNIIQKQVQSVDLMPTILDMVNINYHSREFKGRSLVPLMNNERLSSESNFAISDSRNKVAVRMDGWKLIHNRAKGVDVKSDYELYNLIDDSKELNNLVALEKEKFALLKEKLDQYELSAGLKKVMPNPVLDKETKERLRSFGYVQ